MVILLTLGHTMKLKTIFSSREEYTNSLYFYNFALTYIYVLHEIWNVPLCRKKLFHSCSVLDGDKNQDLEIWVRVPAPSFIYHLGIKKFIFNVKLCNDWHINFTTIMLNIYNHLCLYVRLKNLNLPWWHIWLEWKV